MRHLFYKLRLAGKGAIHKNLIHHILAAHSHHHEHHLHHHLNHLSLTGEGHHIKHGEGLHKHHHKVHHKKPLRFKALF
jgi:hypothetical protein